MRKKYIERDAQCEEQFSSADACKSGNVSPGSPCAGWCAELSKADCESRCSDGICRQTIDSVFFNCDDKTDNELFADCRLQCPMGNICGYQETENRYLCKPCTEGFIANVEQTSCVPTGTYYGCVAKVMFKKEKQNLYYCSQQRFNYFAQQCGDSMVHSADYLSCTAGNSLEGCTTQLENAQQFCVYRNFEYLVADCGDQEIRDPYDSTQCIKNKLLECQLSCSNQKNYCQQVDLSYLCTPCPSLYVGTQDKTKCVHENTREGCAAACDNGYCYQQSGKYLCSSCMREQIMGPEQWCVSIYDSYGCVQQYARHSIDVICMYASALYYQPSKCKDELISSQDYKQCITKLEYCRNECYSTAVFCDKDVENIRGYACQKCPVDYTNSDDRTYCYAIKNDDIDDDEDLLVSLIILFVFVGISLVVVLVLVHYKCQKYNDKQQIIRQQQRQQSVVVIQADENLQIAQLTQQYLDQVRLLKQQGVAE